MSVPSPASAASNSFTILSYAAMALGLDAGTTFGSVLGIVVAFPAVSFASPTTGAETSTGAGGGGAAGGGGGAFAAHSAAFSSPPSAANLASRLSRLRAFFAAFLALFRSFFAAFAPSTSRVASRPRRARPDEDVPEDPEPRESESESESVSCLRLRRAGEDPRAGPDPRAGSSRESRGESRMRRGRTARGGVQTEVRRG